MAKHPIYRKKSIAAAVTAACMTISSAPHAQEDGDSLFEEIIVTATARETSMQDIPYNISAISGDALEAINAVNQNDVLRAMHGITVIDRRPTPDCRPDVVEA